MVARVGFASTPYNFNMASGAMTVVVLDSLDVAPAGLHHSRSPSWRETHVVFTWQGQKDLIGGLVALADTTKALTNPLIPGLTKHAAVFALQRLAARLVSSGYPAFMVSRP